MPDSVHEVTIHSSDVRIYQALTQSNGIQGWWTDRCEMAPAEGGVNRFWFNSEVKPFTMRCQKLLPNQRVFWVCEDGPEEWVNTQLWWEITPSSDKTHESECKVAFKHMNWQRDDGLFPLCNSTWGSLMQQLKHYCETGETAPYFAA